MAAPPSAPPPAPPPGPPAGEAARLALVAALLSLVLGGMAIGRVLLVPGLAGAGLAWLAAFSALASFAVATLLTGRPAAARWTRPLAALLVELFLVNVLASFAVAGESRYFNLLLVIGVGLAGWLLPPRWFAAVWAGGAVVWLSLVLAGDQPLGRQLGRVAGGFALSLLLLAAKRLWLEPAKAESGTTQAAEPEVRALCAALFKEKEQHETAAATCRAAEEERERLRRQLADLRAELDQALAAWQEADVARADLQRQLHDLRANPPRPPGPTEEEWLAELERSETASRALERELAAQRQAAAEAQEALRAAAAARAEVQAELRRLQADHERMKTERQEREQRRADADHERQRLAAELAALEQSLNATRDEAAQLRRALLEAQDRKRKLIADQAADQDQTQAMLAELPVFLLLWDPGGKVRRVAGGGLELVGWQLADPNVAVEALAGSDEPLRGPLRAILADQDYAVELEQNNRLLSVRCTPWKNELGQIRGLLGLVTDLTAQRKAAARWQPARHGESALESNQPPALRLLAFDHEPEADPRRPLPRYAGRALLVDDRREPRRVMTCLLERLGVQVETADFQDQAEQQAAGGRYAVILIAGCLLDQMPALPRRLRQEGVAAPILALHGADAGAAQEAACLAAGCDRVLRLPLAPAELAEALSAYLTEGEPDARSAEAPLLSRQRHDPAYASLIENFVDELPGQIAALWSALCVADLASLIHGAHQIKEAAELYGYPELGQQADRLEQAVLDGQAVIALRSFLKEVEAAARRCARGLAA